MEGCEWVETSVLFLMMSNGYYKCLSKCMVLNYVVCLYHESITSKKEGTL